MTTPTPDLLPTVAANVLRVLDGGNPNYIDGALWDYAWACVEVEHGVNRPDVIWVARTAKPSDRLTRADELIADANRTTARLRTMDRETLRAELERVAGELKAAA